MTAKKRILIIEDEPSILALLEDLLHEEGFTVHTATDGRAGMTTLEEVGADLVLCDVMMPILDGRRVCQLIRTTPTFQHIPVVLMSAVMENSLGLERASYNAFLPKPLDLDELIRTLESLI